ncbi:hypothetical protein [Beggiatoa leptomitoformis]|uniref:Uncharacterized protein n=1 Tax=Beggiatoa leptomitoformis TaxID=288004 RepID=A0A2N9YCQ8_9GAMM|nr:hypothetical protein [Beggiatoa leptomitoformis]ALG66501.1 hypothetical protein AL038_00570 [Beggiatoa leptomitoformis]AUI68204.1 hypothetical protein BLE401_05475 [Beggiatoa leptomitoformis]
MAMYDGIAKSARRVRRERHLSNHTATGQCTVCSGIFKSARRLRRERYLSQTIPTIPTTAPITEQVTPSPSLSVPSPEATKPTPKVSPEPVVKAPEKDYRRIQPWEWSVFILLLGAGAVAFYLFSPH